MYGFVDQKGFISYYKVRVCIFPTQMLSVTTFSKYMTYGFY